MLAIIDKIIFLKQVPFFADMAKDDLHLLASISEEVSFNTGQLILSEGEYGDALYVIVTGHVGVQHRHNDLDETPSFQLARLGPREYFGEMSLFSGAPYSADILALSPTDVLRVRRDALFALIKKQPLIVFGVLAVLSERLRRAEALLADQQTQPL